MEWRDITDAHGRVASILIVNGKSLARVFPVGIRFGIQIRKLDPVPRWSPLRTKPRASGVGSRDRTWRYSDKAKAEAERHLGIT